jgi:hypothetical protein
MSLVVPYYRLEVGLQGGKSLILLGKDLFAQERKEFIFGYGIVIFV